MEAGNKNTKKTFLLRFRACLSFLQVRQYATIVLRKKLVRVWRRLTPEEKQRCVLCVALVTTKGF